MDKDNGYVGTLFKEMAYFDAKKLNRCRTCKYRRRFLLSEYSNKVIQCCVLQPSTRSNSGWKTIKASDIACSAYEKDE